MSQPTPPPAQPDQPQRVALIAATLIAGAATAGAGARAAAAPFKLTAAALSALTRLFLRWRYSRATIRHAVRVLTRIIPAVGPGSPPSLSPGETQPGPAQVANDRAAFRFAAWFLERSTARVQAGGDPAREDRYIEQHLDAQARRREAAKRVDLEAVKPDNVTDEPAGRVILTWRAHPDDRTTPECAAADGAWFYADTPPVIGYPGMPHGGTCRCWPAHAGSLAAVARGRHVNDAVRAIIDTEPEHRTHPGAVPERQAS